jgi:His/Glu/Gln/Arg/opine family amino acid ABC transporter permease subunit
MGNVIDFSFALEVFGKLIGYVPVTLGLALSSMFFASVLGLAVMFVRWRRIPVLGQLATFYVIIGRALPTLIVLYLVFFGLPLLLLILSGGKVNNGFNQISPLVFAVLGLTLHSGAYLAEIFRTAVQSVNKGQMEAALSVGMTSWESFRRIVLPQAAVLALPLMSNQFLGLIKGTSIAFMITVMELFGAANVISSLNNRYLEVYIATAILYWLVSICFEKAFQMLEAKMSFFKERKI